MKKRSYFAQISNRRAIFLMVFFFISGIGLLLLPRLLAKYESIAEVYSLRIFPILSFIPSRILNLFPISLTEVFVVSSVFLVLIMLTAFFIRMKHSQYRLRTLRNMCLLISVIFFVMAYQYTTMHGLNFFRQPIWESLMLDSVSEAGPDKIEQAMNFYLDGIISAQAELENNEKGETLLLSSIPSTLRAGNDSIDNAATVHSLFSGNKVVPKPVVLSKYWSYTQIAGMYNPIFVEANINVDTPKHETPLTVCHEIAHVRGIAREDEANMASFIACLYSDRADYRYAAHLYAFESLMEDMRLDDPDTYDALMTRLPNAVLADWQASRVYWSQFDGRLSEMSNRANDSFLKANQQEDGVQSYHLSGRFFLNYYYLYLADQS